MKAIVYIEVRDGKPRTSSLEAIGAAKQASAGDITAVVSSECISPAEIGKWGASRVLVFEHNGFLACETAAQALIDAAKRTGSNAFFLSATPKGKEIAPRVAACTDSGFLGDVLELKAEGDSLLGKRSLYGGKLLGWYRSSPSVVVTTRVKAFAASQGGAEAPVERFALTASPCSVSNLVEAGGAKSGKADLTEADIIVSGGRGMKAPENFGMLDELADVLNGVVGASRAAVDAGWREHSDQVGQTGKVVSPQVYFACGISGAIQHLAGMSSSKVIIAINKDPEAPIFKVADYGIVGDVSSVVPALTAEIRKARQ